MTTYKALGQRAAARTRAVAEAERQVRASQARLADEVLATALAERIATREAREAQLIAERAANRLKWEVWDADAALRTRTEKIFEDQVAWEKAITS